MQAIGERPRELKWYHAAGLLFGDWGTSRLYVLGLAFTLSGHASFWYVAAMCGLVTLVGVAYAIICEHYPDGGGVYSAAKRRSKALAVAGALLLFADYTVTAAMSAYEGFRYLLPSGCSPNTALYLAIVAIIGIGMLGLYGCRRAGVLAVAAAGGALVCYLVLAAVCILKTGHAQIEIPTGTVGERWDHFINVILALSGVEAIANMTGVMAKPAGRNAKLAIGAVLLEVVALNLVMAYAMNALNSMGAYDVNDQRDHMVKILAAEYVGPIFASISAIFFGILLVSAANTAVNGMVSIMYIMAVDKEMPSVFHKLNSHGVPWVGLMVAAAIPCALLLVVGADTEVLAGLYAIGVVGAISINLLSTGTNFKLAIKPYQRTMLLAIGGFMTLTGISVAIDKPPALLFAALVVGTGLFLRSQAKRAARQYHAAISAVRTHVMPALNSMLAPSGGAGKRILVPTGGNPRLLEFAADYASNGRANLLVLYVREVALAFRDRDAVLSSEEQTLENDDKAQEAFATARRICEAKNVGMTPIYVVHDSAADVILDQAATMGVDAVLMGASRRNALWKFLRGDILQEVSHSLPEGIHLLIHA